MTASNPAKSTAVNDATIACQGIARCPSPAVEKALRELAQMPVTEACLSGLCDICLYQTGLCMIFSQHGEDSYKSRRSADPKK